MTGHDVAEWVTAIGTAATGAGILILWLQLRSLHEQATLLTSQLKAMQEQSNLLITQIKADHDRSRKENAIKMLWDWTRGLLRSASLARKLVESLDDAQTKLLVEEKPMRLGIEKKNMLLGVLSKLPEAGLQEDKNRGEIILGESEVSDIRWHIIHYLNSLESVFAAVRHNVADRRILVEQFGFLVSPREGHHMLKKFREVLGAEGYPALYELEAELNTPRPPKPGERAADAILPLAASSE